MQEATKIKSRKMAESFYKKHFPNEQPTTGKIIKALQDIASEYRPDSWRNLRNAIRLDQTEKGYNKGDILLAVKNPTTLNRDDKSGVKSKQQRCKTVSQETAFKMFKHLSVKEDTRMWAAFMIGYITGCRPAEMNSIIQLSSNEFVITGAKKSEKGDRGLDRTVRVLDEKHARLLAKAVSLLANEQNMKQVQNNIATAARSLYPMHSQRGKRPTLYSLRHQHGSNLKKSGMSRSEVAYLMGHQSTVSVEVYGSRRSGRGGLQVEAGVSSDVISSLVRENHSAMPEQRQERGRTMDRGLSM